jgi:type I restriction enzyme, S subunit
MSSIEGWVETPLRDLLVLVKGVSYGSEDYCGPGEGAHFITIKCVSKAGGFKPEGIKFFKGRIPKSQQLRPGDLLIANTDLTRAGDIVGCPVIVPSMDADEMTMSMDLSKLVEDEAKVSRSFLYYVLMTDLVRRFMKEHASGSTVLHLQTQAVPRLLLIIPRTISEQEKIAEILSTVDRAIGQTETLIAKQQRIKVGLLRDLLTRGIDEHGNLRSEQTHNFKDSPLGRIPEEWGTASISSILAKPPKNGFSPVESAEWAGAYVLGLGCLTPEGFRAKQLKFAPPVIPPTNAARLNAGDFLISRSNTRSLVGLVGIFRDVGEPCTYPDLMVRLVFSGEVLSEYMEQVFMSPLMRRQIENAATGTSGSMVKISGALIRGFVFTRPPVEEQRRILSKLKAEDSNLGSTVQSLSKLRSLKTALMQDLLSGKKRVTTLLEPAVQLMRRVS